MGHTSAIAIMTPIIGSEVQSITVALLSPLHGTFSLPIAMSTCAWPFLEFSGGRMLRFFEQVPRARKRPWYKYVYDAEVMDCTIYYTSFEAYGSTC